MTKPVNSEFQKILKLIVDSAEKQLSLLPPKEAAAARKKIRRIALATASRVRAEACKPARARSRRASPSPRAKVS